MNISRKLLCENNETLQTKIFFKVFDFVLKLS